MISIGIDLGTTSIKVCIVKKGKILLEKSRRHESEEELGNQNPQKIIFSSLQCLKEAIQEYSNLPGTAGKIGRLRIAGQMHGIVAWNGKELQEGKIISSPLFTWMYPNDPQVMEQLPKPSRPVFPGFGAVSLLEHRLYKDYDRCGTIMDLLACYLCNNQEQVKMSWQLAESFGYCSDGKWDQCLGDRIHEDSPNPNFQLPKIIENDQFILGTVDPTRFEELAGVDVFIPLGDLQASIKSVADDNLDVAYLILGTSSQISVIASKNTKISCPTVDTLPFTEENVILAGRSMNGGNAIDAFLKLLSSWSAEATGSAGSPPNVEKLLTDVDNCSKSEKSSPSRPTASATPLFIQERGLPLIGANISGLDHHTSLVQVLQAICTGVIDNLLTLFPLELMVPLGIKKVYMVGNAKKPRFATRIEELSKQAGITAVGAESDTSAAYGAAIF